MPHAALHFAPLSPAFCHILLCILPQSALHCASFCPDVALICLHFATFCPAFCINQPCCLPPSALLFAIFSPAFCHVRPCSCHTPPCILSQSDFALYEGLTFCHLLPCDATDCGQGPPHGR
jgi:hypothetical protein